MCNVIIPNRALLNNYGLPCSTFSSIPPSGMSNYCNIVLICVGHVVKLTTPYLMMKGSYNEDPGVIVVSTYICSSESK